MKLELESQMVFNIRLAERLLSRTSRSTFSCKTCASMGTCQMQKKLAWHKFWLLLYLFLFFITLWYFRYFSILEKVARTLEIPQTQREPEYKKYSFYYLPGSSQKSFKVSLFLGRCCAILSFQNQNSLQI